MAVFFKRRRFTSNGNEKPRSYRLIKLLILVVLFVLAVSHSIRNGVTTEYVLMKRDAMSPSGFSIQGASVSSPDCVLPDGTKVVELRDKNGKKRFDIVVTEGDFMSEFIAKNGFWEIREVQDVADLSPVHQSLPDVAEGAFYDVGGNIGYYSFLFAAAGYSVVAFEPLPTNIALFKTTLCLNPELATRITLFETGLSDNEAVCRLVGTVNPRTKVYLNGIATLLCPDQSSGIPLKPCDPDKDFICQDVAVSTLDGVVLKHEPPLPRASIVKMDIEGHELQALLGGGKFFEQHRPALVQFEFKNPKMKGVPDWLIARGYEIGTLRGHDENTVARYTGGGNVVTASV
jgi:FkbM family methyltransferase